MPLYTRRGDQGETDVIGGRLSKDHPRIEVLGVLDELNAVLGLVISTCPDRQIVALLRPLQRDLFTLGAACAVVPPHKSPISLSRSVVNRLEKTIDRLTAEAPPPNRFVLPGGSLAAAFTHLARAVCRRAERSLVRLSRTDRVDPLIIQYLNRLSDLLFAVALLLNKRTGTPETFWEGARRRAVKK
ncbi:MAG: cob(I)yrinic acid a,c-diamide adenosyltransferase [Armatimonadetes bacterium]|nr:cob(I)yrinic acid a,c-diamide adenosyltransferase [Armatimonadota bacterium]MDW8121150.1 cob(I)yrinic acid a,c-diamide adenosyltransferase [Armatimonadota bacterium]